MPSAPEMRVKLATLPENKWCSYFSGILPWNLSDTVLMSWYLKNMLETKFCSCIVKELYVSSLELTGLSPNQRALKQFYSKLCALLETAMTVESIEGAMYLIIVGISKILANTSKYGLASIIAMSKCQSLTFYKKSSEQKSSPIISLTISIGSST